MVLDWFSWLLLFCLNSLTFEANSDAISLPNSCVNLEDGEHWIKLLEDTNDVSYPPINVNCQNGYAILDYSHDNNIGKYFSSFVYWHYGVVGPAPNDRVNWQEWYLPYSSSSSDSTKFALSPDCNSCDYNEEWQVYGDDTTYWMTGNTFQCWWSVKGVGECEMDYFTYDCYECASWQDNSVSSYKTVIDYDNTDSKIWRNCGECTHAVKPSFSKTPQNHDECQAYSFEGTFQPSIGIDGRYCVCTQQTNMKMIAVDQNTFKQYKLQFDSSKIETEETEEAKTSENNIVHLYQKDFAEGTYRIKESGHYIIMEDIEFDFNNIDSENEAYNNPTDGWFPLSSQQDKYPGAGQYRDNFFLGFFAGITIECDDVILDLNNHELKQSKPFYYAQRWFSIVELASSMFLPGQGNGFFGNEFGVASNTHIKNGVLGLTSHFGIHGNNNENIYIENVQIKDFETHGIHMNWFNNVNINNVEIGPASKIVYLKPEYGEARYLLPRLRVLEERFPDEKMQFYGRDEETTVGDIADELQIQLEYAFWYALGDDYHNKIDFDSDSWHSAKKLFINNEGMTSTSGLHGIFLNTIASPVLFTYRLSTEEYSTNANIENVKIHGLTHAMDEWIRIHHHAEEIWWNAFMGPLDARSAIDDIDKLDETIRYKGDVVIDSYIALNHLGYDDWDILGRQAIGDGTLVNWALGTNTDLADNSEPYTLDIDNILIGCNCDAQLHSGKGVLGLRIDSVENVNIKNVEVYELEDVTQLGLQDCGPYDKFSIFDSDGSHRGGGHFVQRPPMQNGFSGNMVQGISIASSKNVIIEDIHTHDFISHTGQTFGISIWPGNDNVELKGNILTEHMMAGLQVNARDIGLGYMSLPNQAPEACGTRVDYEYTKSDTGESYVTTLTVNENSNIQSQCISGEVGCIGSLTDKTVIGEEISTLNSNCRDPISAVDLLDDVLNDNGQKVVMNKNAIGDAEDSIYSWQKSMRTKDLIEKKRNKNPSKGKLLNDNDNESELNVGNTINNNSDKGLFGLNKLQSAAMIGILAVIAMFTIYAIVLRKVSANNVSVDNKIRYMKLRTTNSGSYGAV